MTEDSKQGDADRENPTPEKTPASHPWRRRIAWGLIAFLVVVIVPVALAPYLLSTGAGTRLVLGIANGQIQGKVSAGDLSTSWSGPTEIRAIKVVDPQGREVVNANRVTYSGGAWKMITAPQDFTQLTADSPRVVLYLDSTGKPSLADALTPRKPSPPAKTSQPSKPWTQQSRQILVNDGSVRVVAAEGPSYEVNHLATDVDLTTMQQVKAKLQFTSPEGTRLNGNAELVDLISPDGQLQLGRSTIQGRLFSDGQVDLAPIAALFAPGSQLAGKANIDVAAHVAGGQGPIKLDLAFKGLQAARSKTQGVEPVDLAVQGVMDISRQSLTGALSVQSEAIKAKVDFAYPNGQDAKMPGDFLSAVLVGRDVAMPEFTVKGSAKVDLPRLQKAMPNLMATRKDVQLTGGVVEASQFSLAGGREPKATFAGRMADVQGRSSRGEFRLEPVTGDCDVALRENVGLVLVKPAQLKASFIDFHAQGTAGDLEAKYEADLQKLAQQLGQIVDLGSTTLAGKVTAQMTAKRGEDRNIQLAAEVKGTSLAYTSGDKHAAIESLLVSREGLLEVADNKLVRFTIRKDHLEVGRDLIADFAGWYDFRDSACNFNLQLARADLAGLGRTVSGLGLNQAAGWGGTASGKAQVSRASGKTPLKGGADFTIQSPLVNGKPLTTAKSPIALAISKVEMDPKAGTYHMGEAKLTSDFANVTVTELRMHTGAMPVVECQYTLQGNVGPTMTVASTVTGATDLPDMSGTMNGSGTVRTQEQRINAVGRYAIDNLTLKREGKTVKESQISLDCTSTLDRGADRLKIDQFQFRSQPLNVEMAGTVDKVSGQKTLDLDAHYKGSWNHILELLHQFAPSTAETIAMQGEPEDRFKITGSAYNPNLSGVMAKPSIGWTEARMYGLQMEKAKLTPSIRDGVMVLPVTTIPGASGGQANIGFELSLSGKTKVLKLPGHIKVLDNFQVNKDVGKYILSRINPMLGQTTQMSGRIVLETDNVILPLGPEIKTQSSGKAMLDLSDLQVVPAGVMGDLLKLTGLGKAGTYVMSVRKVNFSLNNGRISYDNFTIRVAAFDLVFRGWVDFDDNVNLVVSIPLTPSLLNELKIPGLPRGTLDLSGLRVDIPLKGKRWAPVLDLKAVNGGKILNDILKKTGDLLKPPKLF